MPDDRGVAGVFAAGLREMRDATLSPPPPPEEWHPHQLRDTETDPEAEAPPAPAFSTAALLDAYRQRTAADESTEAVTP